MTKEQTEACEKLAYEIYKGDGGHTILNSRCFKDGFKAAQNPEMLMLNPLVKGLVGALDELNCLMEDVRTGNYEPDSFTNQPSSKALAPFGKLDD